MRVSIQTSSSAVPLPSWRDPADGIAARHDHLPQVRTLHAALLQRLDVDGNSIVDVHQAHRPLVPLSQSGRQRVSRNRSTRRSIDW